MQSLTPVEAARFLKEAERDRWSAIFVMALATGLRPSEYLGLKWADIDLERGLNPGFKPKFLRTYANAFDIIQAALNAYDRDVKSGRFPNDSESYSQIHQFNRGVA